MAISYVSREFTTESIPPWLLCTKVRGAPGSCAEACLTSPSLRLVARVPSSKRLERRLSALAGATE